VSCLCMWLCMSYILPYNDTKQHAVISSRMSQELHVSHDYWEKIYVDINAGTTSVYVTIVLLKR